MAARTSIIDESADDGVPADFWNEVLDSFEVMGDEFGEDDEDPRKAAEERIRKKKEEEVKRFNEAWNITSSTEDPSAAVEKSAETTSTTNNSEKNSTEQTMSVDVPSVEDDNTVTVIPAEGQAKDPRLKRLEESHAQQSPSSPTQESRANIDRDVESSQRYRRDREDFERARSRLRSRSPGLYSRVSISDDEDDSDRRVSTRSARSRSRYRSRSPRRGRRSRSRSWERGRSRHPSRSRSKSRDRSSMMAQMNAMMQMMMDPKAVVNPMMAMMMQMNPMMAAAAAAASQKTAETQKETTNGEQSDKKDDVTAQLFLNNQINLSDYMAAKKPGDGKQTSRVDSSVVQRLKESITVLDKHETKVQSSRFLYVAPTYYTDLKKIDNRSPLIWNDQNVLYSLTSKSKDVGLCDPFHNINQKMKQMIERLGLDEGNISQRIGEQKKQSAVSQGIGDVGTVHSITIVPVKGGVAAKRLIERSIQTDEQSCLDCLQRRSKTYVSVNTQTAGRARKVDVSVQTLRGRDVELNSMNDLNANQVKIINEIMKYMKKRQVSGTMTNLMHSLERDAPELRNQQLNAGLHYVSEITERNERNANRYAGPNPLNPLAREMASRQLNRDQRGSSFHDSHRGVNFDQINQLTSMVPAGFRASPPRKNNHGHFNRRPW